MRIKSFAFLILILVIVPAAPAAQKSPPLFTADQLRADLLQIRETLEKNHPAVFAFTDRQSFETLVEKQRGLIDRPMTLGEFYVIAAPLVAAVACGHTRLSTPMEYWASAPDRFFPLAVRIFRGRLYVVGGPVPAGNEILRINGIASSGIISSLKSLVSSDGNNPGNVIVRVTAAFPWLYAHRYGFPQEFVVETWAPKEMKEAAFRLRPATFAGLPADAFARTRSTSTGDPNLDFEILSDPADTAVLTIRSFAYYQSVERFESFLDDSFARIRKTGIKSLILDLRNNAGGDPFCTTPLLGYLEPKPVPYFAREYPGGYARLAGPIPRAENAFEGKLYVLINAGCFSSTGHLVALFKEHAIGTLIGTPTGGTYECNDAAREFILENTRLRLFVARMTFTAAVKNQLRFHGVSPDVAIEPTIDDYLSGRDADKEAALSLIKKRDPRAK